MVNRWWVYQRERFPILVHAPLIAVVSVSAVAYSGMVRGRNVLPDSLTMLVAFGSTLLFFLQLRIADEFKDYAHDLRDRPHRPVQRGLVRRRELAALGLLAAGVQLALALILEPSLVLLLVGVWCYMALMSKEFFVGSWLRARPGPYLLSHLVVVALIVFYATACDWWPAEQGPPLGLAWFLAASYFNGIVLEIGRKLRAAEEGEPGAETYRTAWGARNAALVWLGAVALTAVCASLAARQIDFAPQAAYVLGILLVLAVIAVVRFLRGPAARDAKWIEIASAAWTLLMYLSVGVMPLFWKYS